MYEKKVKQWILQKLLQSVMSKLVDAVIKMSTLNLYEYQRSRLFIDLGPRSLKFTTFSSFFSLEPAWPIEAKFHVEPPLDGGMKVCSNGPGHMTSMAAMPIYGKNLKKSSSLEPNSRLL